MPALYQNKTWLIEHYVEKKMSAERIAALFSCHVNTIYTNMAKNGIARRKPGATIITAEILNRLRTNRHPTPMLNKRHTAETKASMSESRKGEKNACWKGGRTLTIRKFRKSRQYRKWRLQVLKRDNYKCQYNNCGLHTNIAHHIIPVKTSPDLMFDTDNGMAVCLQHHKLIHKNIKETL